MRLVAFWGVKVMGGEREKEGEHWEEKTIMGEVGWW